MTKINETPAKEEEPKTIVLPNGEEWTIESPLIHKSQGLYGLARGDEKPDAYILDRQVLRFGGANLVVFHQLLREYHAYRVSWEKRHDQILWFGLFLGVLLAYFSVRIMESVFHINLHQQGWYWGIPFTIFMATSFFFLIPVANKHCKKREQAEEAAQNFRQAIINAQHPGIKLEDIGRYILLPDKETSSLAEEVAQRNSAGC